MIRIFSVLIICSLTIFKDFLYPQSSNGQTVIINKVFTNEIIIGTGSGSFKIPGGGNHEKDTIKVFYYKPIDYKPHFEVIMVIPGGGRNGDTYRDSWIELSEKYDLLVLSPSYSKKYYPGPASYNMGGMAKSSLFTSFFTINSNPKDWIFQDFDRIFDIATKKLGSTEKRYDIFGHSAGGQIAHRLALFYPNSKANRIVAANSGWYTLPDFGKKFPYGLKKTPVVNEDLGKSFGINLVIMLGELDNEYETRGHLRKTREAKKQGAGRLQRGNFFYQAAMDESKQLQFELLWEKVIIKNVGHSYRKIGVAAAEYLYGNDK